MEDKNMLSYAQFIRDRRNFRNAGCDIDKNGGEEFNYFDMPSQSYFKLFFYFYNGNSNLGVQGESDLISSGGLLAPTWQHIDINDTEYYKYNSAWSFLKMNDENERAEKLEQFVSLLSDISTKSPWYFSEISGVDEALNRKEFEEANFKIDETRKKISIKCIPDAIDHRIGKLLDLYRDIAYSWSMKREIIPANLRKFDMGLYIFETPTSNLSIKSNASLTDYGELNEKSSKYASSYKLIEFHNCEFNYNSSKSGYGSINNKEGFQQEYTIEISFDDCYEIRYDEFIMRTIGDIVTTDTALVVFNEDGTSNNNTKSIAQGDVNSFYNDKATILLREHDLQNRLYEEIEDSLLWSTLYNNDVEISSSGDSIHGTKFDRAWDRVKKKLSDTGKDLLSTVSQFKDPKELLKDVAEQAGGYVWHKATQGLKHLYLGNLFGMSISNLTHNLSNALNGDVFGAAGQLSQDIQNSVANKNITKNDLGTLKTPNSKGYIRTSTDAKTSALNNLGNIFKANTLVNNL